MVRPKGLRSFSMLTLDFWLNFDSSICIITPGPPYCVIGLRSSAPHATSRHFRVNLFQTFREAVSSIPITLSESFVPISQEITVVFLKKFYFQLNMSLLSLTTRPQRKHFLLSSLK